MKTWTSSCSSDYYFYHFKGNSVFNILVMHFWSESQTVPSANSLTWGTLNWPGNTCKWTREKPHFLFTLTEAVHFTDALSLPPHFHRQQVIILHKPPPVPTWGLLRRGMGSAKSSSPGLQSAAGPPRSSWTEGGHYMHSLESTYETQEMSFGLWKLCFGIELVYLAPRVMYLCLN